MNANLAHMRGWTWPKGWTMSASHATVVAALMAVILAFAPTAQSLAGETSQDGLGTPDDKALFADWTVVEDEALSDNRGGQSINLGDLGLNIASNHSTLTGNSVNGDVDTGHITANSLNDVSGINSLMFNSGNNVSFQNSMQINIFLK